jgi:hypothetical protein
MTTMMTMRTSDPPVRRLSSPEFPASSHAARSAAIGPYVRSFFMPASFIRQSLHLGIPEGSARKLIREPGGFDGRSAGKESSTPVERWAYGGKVGTCHGAPAGRLFENEAMER